jgi:hypothetical protein
MSGYLRVLLGAAIVLGLGIGITAPAATLSVTAPATILAGPEHCC